MPIPIAAYGCQFQCGAPLASGDEMAAHERNCLLNPVNRACLSCEHDRRNSPMYSPTLLKENQGLVLHICVLGHRSPRVSCRTNCKHYEQKRGK